MDFVDKYGELHHNGSVWRAYAYFEAPNRAENCQIQRPNDPSKIFVDTVPDVWPKAVSDVQSIYDASAEGGDVFLTRLFKSCVDIISGHSSNWHHDLQLLRCSIDNTKCSSRLPVRACMQNGQADSDGRLGPLTRLQKL